MECVCVLQVALPILRFEVSGHLALGLKCPVDRSDSGLNWPDTSYHNFRTVVSWVRSVRFPLEDGEGIL